MSTVCGQRSGSAEDLVDPRYIAQIQDCRLLSAVAERQLASRIRLGDAEARDHLIRANLRLVVKIARERPRHSLPLSELISEGNLGLIHAVEQFDPGKGVRFSTYARFWIVQAMRRAEMAGKREIRFPAYVYDLLSRWRQTRRDLELQAGRAVSGEAVFAALALPASKAAILRRALTVEEALAGNRRGDDHGISNVPTQDSDIGVDAMAVAEQLDRLTSAVAALPTPLRDLVVRAFGLDEAEPLNESQLARHTNLSRQRVRRQLQQALFLLRTQGIEL